VETPSVTTKAAPSASAVLEHHRCTAVTCTACRQSFNDDFTHHFASLPHVVRIVTNEDWILTATGVLCWSCVDDLDHDQRPTNTAVAVAKCESCWPPPFSDTPAPEACCCANVGAATRHDLVPLVMLTHRGFEQHVCVSARCPECQSGQRAHDDDMGAPHYDSLAAALHAAQKTYDWLVTGTLTCCASCARTHEWAALSHPLPDAPDRVTDDRIEQRGCRHCSSAVMNRLADTDMPWR
jgi:hypothetical protein